MSATATAASAAADAAPAPKKGKKKLIIIIAAVVLLLLAVAGGATVFVMKKKAAEAAAAAEAEGGEEAAAGAKKPAKAEKAHAGPPTFVPLEAFVVNLADREVDRFAQIGITLELDDPKFAEQIKAYLPAIRNGILMILAHKTSQQLLERSGKEQLAAEIARETVRPMGIEIEAPEAEEGAGKKKLKTEEAKPNPVRHVHFSSFIVQ
jgi:flagellar FliL protein